MQIKLLFQALLIFFSSAISPSVADAATASEKTTGNYCQVIVPQQKHKSGILTNWLAKRMATKMLHASDDTRIHKLAKAGFAWGLISILCLILGVGIPSLFLLSMLACILGYVKSIKALINIRNSEDPEHYYKEKRKAVWGIVLSTIGLLAVIAGVVTFYIFLA